MQNGLKITLLLFFFSLLINENPIDITEDFHGRYTHSYYYYLNAEFGFCSLGFNCAYVTYHKYLNATYYFIKMRNITEKEMNVLDCTSSHKWLIHGETMHTFIERKFKGIEQGVL